MASFIRTDDHLTIVFDNGESVTVYPSNPNYGKVVAALKDKDYDLVRRYAIPAAAVQDKIAKVVRRGVGHVELLNGVVYYNGEAVHNTLTDRIVQMATEGFDIEPMCKFLANLQDNPSYRAVTELYGFLEKGNLPITEDGHFLAYKRVRNDYTDCHTGTMSNAVGQVVEMPRNKVNEDAQQTCSYGLHFCSRDYLQHFGNSSGNRTVILKINPADVVAIPADYNDTKGRCCRYEVIGELEHMNEAPLEGAFRPSDDYNEPEDEDYEYDDSEYNDEDEDEDKHYYNEESEWNDDEEEGWVSVGTVSRGSDGNLKLSDADGSVDQLEAIDPETGDVADTFDSVRDAADYYGIEPSAINRVLRGDRKTTAGHAWRWARADVTTPHPEHLKNHHEHGTLYGGKPHGTKLADQHELDSDDDYDY